MQFWRELKYFISEIKNGYQRQSIEHELYERLEKIRSSELRFYVYNECLTFASTLKPKRLPWIGIIAEHLYARCARGKKTLEDCRNIFEKEVGK